MNHDLHRKPATCNIFQDLYHNSIGYIWTKSNCEVHGVRRGENTQTPALTWGFGDAAYLNYHYALIISHREAAEEFLGADRTTPLSAYDCLSSLHSTGSVVRRGRVVLQSSRETRVYWGVAATRGKKTHERRCLAVEKRKEREKEREHIALWTADHSVRGNCCSNCLTCWCDVILQFFLYRLAAVKDRWVTESQVFSSEDSCRLFFHLPKK